MQNFKNDLYLMELTLNVLMKNLRFAISFKLLIVNGGRCRAHEL